MSSTQKDSDWQQISYVNQTNQSDLLLTKRIFTLSYTTASKNRKLIITKGHSSEQRSSTLENVFNLLNINQDS